MLSREFLLERGYCCGHGCLMCPYEPKHIKNNTDVAQHCKLCEKNKEIASGYVILFITVPLFYFIYGIFKAKVKKDYYNLSQLIKVVMLTGTLSMLVFTLIFNS